jgi:hypothetical protein
MKSLAVMQSCRLDCHWNMSPSGGGRGRISAVHPLPPLRLRVAASDAYAKASAAACEARPAGDIVTSNHLLFTFVIFFVIFTHVIRLIAKQSIMRRNHWVFILLICTQILSAQSKSISRFRADHPENTNMFFYSSTLKMLNTENNAQLADLIRDIEEIRVLNYDKEKQHLTSQYIAGLKKALTEEDYNNLMMMNEKGNAINLYSREKHGKTVGFVALVEDKGSLTVIDLVGSIDVKKFMELKNSLDAKMNQSSN